MKKENLSVGKLFDRYNQSISKENNEFEKKLVQNYTESIIDPAEELRQPEVAFKQILEDGEERIIGTLGNFLLISGKAKSRKSFLVNMIVASLLSGKKINGIQGCLPNNKRKGLLFDTEQGRYHVQKAQKRIYKIAEIFKTADLDVITLRKYNPSERLKLIEYGIKNSKNLGYVIIDGIRDLVSSINSEEEATLITSKFLKWTEELGIHLIVVLHQNKGNENARGHLGTEAVNKAESHLSATKAPLFSDITLVEPQETRDREPEPFAFEISDGLPVLVKDYEIKTSKDKSSIDVADIEDKTLYSMLEAIYEKGEMFTHSDLVVQLKLEFKNTFKKSIGRNKSIELITLCKNKNFLLQEKLRKPYSLGKIK